MESIAVFWRLMTFLLYTELWVYPVDSSHCDESFFDPVNDCLNHPLRVGYWASPDCGSLHSLTDSNGKEHADFARLNHPAIYHSHNGASHYHEYIASQFLTIRLSRKAMLNGIALEGSPNNRRYYLTSFEVWKKVLIYNSSTLTTTQKSSSEEGFYEEGGLTKRFEGNMQSAQKFAFTFPFIADELRIYPVTFLGAKSFRVELYGCYLGRVLRPSQVAVNQNYTFRFEKTQSTQNTSLVYEMKFTEPNGQIHVLRPVASTSSVVFKFLSSGMGTIKLGMLYSTGWITVDEINFIVQGEIKHLKFKVDNKEEYALVENQIYEFALSTSYQPYQMFRTSFVFGDGVICSSNYCRKKYSRGFFQAEGKAENDFFHSRVDKAIAVCPVSRPSVNIFPKSNYFTDRMALRYADPVNNVFRFEFYAISNASIISVVNNNFNFRNYTYNSNGTQSINLTWPGSLPVGLYPITFNFTDGCGMQSRTVKCYIEEKIIGTTLRINQPFKDHLIHNVTEFYTAEYVTFFVDILNGSNANCFVNIQRHGFSTTYSTKRLTAKSFATNYTFSTAGIYLVRAWCKNFLIINEEISQLSVTVIVRPIEMRNFTLTLTPKVVAVNHAFSIYIIMTSGTEIFCIINSTSANISLRSSYPSLSGRRYITGGWHRYPFSLVTSYYGTPHTITVTCENSLGRVIDSRDIQVQIPVSNLVISANETICIGSNLTIYSALSAGAPVTIEAVFDRITTSSINSTYTISNHTFNFPPSIYRNISGWKFVEAKASNAISQIVSNKVWIKFSAIIQSLNVSAEFDVPPNPAPFQAPSYILPTSSSVTFNTNVDPFLPTGNYLYAWKIGDGSFSANSTDPSFSHIFYNSGVYSISTKVVGCQEEISTENFTAVNPVEYFDVTVTPWPYIAVNFSIKLNISRAKHSECMEVAFGDKHNLSSETLFGWNNCRAAPPSNYSIATGNNTSDLAWFIREYPVTKRGNYTILITAVNLLYMINRNFSILAGDCYIPTFNATDSRGNVAIIGNTILNVSNVVQVKRSENLQYSIHDITTNCELSSKYVIRWKFFSFGLNASSEPSQIATGNTALNLNTDNTQLSVSCCFLSYGYSTAIVTLEMTGLHTSAFRYTRKWDLLVDETPLMAVIAGGSYVEFDFGFPYVLDGRNSRDPDSSSLKQSHMKFSWICQDITTNYTDISKTNLTALPSINHKTASLRSRGCFGSHYGLLDTSSKLIEFNTYVLQENHTYEFTLVIAASNIFGERRSYTTQRLYVQPRETPKFDIRCVENCNGKVDASGKFALRVPCENSLCSNSTFQWRLIMHSLDGDTQEDLQPLLYSKITSLDLTMRPDVLQVGESYSLILKGVAPSGAFIEKGYKFTVNKRPEFGKCSINPRSGEALLATFNITCTDWRDIDLPLTYEVAHVTEILTAVLCEQKEETCSTVLPLSTNSNSSIHIRIRIYDSFRMFTEVTDVVDTFYPSLGSNGLDGVANLLDNVKDDQQMAQRIGAIASVLNSPGDQSQTDQTAMKTKLRDTAMSRLSGMVNSSDSVITPLITVLAEVPEEFSPSSASIGTETNIRLTNEMLTENATTLSFRSLVERSKNCIAATGMIMKSTSVNLDPHNNRTNTSWKVDEGEALIHTNVNGMNNITIAIFDRLSPVEDPISLRTPALEILLDKPNPENSNQSTVAEALGAKVSLPPVNDLNLTKAEIDNLNAELIVSNFNSYFWDSTSTEVNSGVVSYSLKAPDGSSLNVNNTQDKITILIPRYTDFQPPFENWLLSEANTHVIRGLENSSIHFEFMPSNYCLSYELLLKFDAKPTKSDYDRKKVIPDFSSCNSTGKIEELRFNICSVYSRFVSTNLHNASGGNCTLRRGLDIHIKNLTSQCSLNPYHLFVGSNETKDGTYYLGIYPVETNKVWFTDNPVQLNKSQECKINETNSTTYYLRTYRSKCIFWNKNESWSSDGCQVSKFSNVFQTVCECNHLTSFASNFLVAPNPIDISKVLEGFKNISNNYMAVVTISIIIGIYILLVIYLRRKDKQDTGLVRVSTVDYPGSHMEKGSKQSYHLLIITTTGARNNAGTSAHVFFTLCDEFGETNPRILYDPVGPVFDRDQINAFKVTMDRPLGEVECLRIWHDNEGENPSWYLSRIYVEDLQSKARYNFTCENWLAVDSDDASVERVLSVASKAEKPPFAHLFTTKVAEDFTDQHIWLSIFTKRPHDRFSRIQRVTCCLVLLMTTMLTSAMFFNLGGASVYVFRIGSLIIDYKGIIIGIQSALIVIPINTIIMFLFKRSARNSSPETKAEERDRDLDETHETGTEMSESELNTIKSGSEKGFIQSDESMKQNRKRRYRTNRPTCLLVFAWLISVLAVAACIVVILFYSMIWGDTVTRQWLVSVFTGFFQSAFVIQPVKLIVVAMILALILRQPKEEDEVLDAYKKAPSNRADEDRLNFLKLIAKVKSSPLSGEQLEIARKREIMKDRLGQLIKDVVSYVIFLMFLSFVVHGYRDPEAYRFAKILEKTVIGDNFQEIKDVPSLWSWIQYNVLPGIYENEWYNGDEFPHNKFFQVREAFGVGPPRIRQVRIKPGLCKVPDEVKVIINECNVPYSLSDEEERNFRVGWKNNKRKRRSITAISGQDNLHRNFDIIRDSATERDELVLERSRRALRVKINRQTPSVSGSFESTGTIEIDSQYLLPDGTIKTNETHWNYNSASDLRGFPYFGKLYVYSGGGYLAKFGRDIDFARAIAAALEQDIWIDKYTRAVFVEFSVYNAYINQFGTAFIIVEILPTGQILPNGYLKVFKLYRYVGTAGRMVMAGEMALILLLIYFMYKECRRLYRDGFRNYLSSFWGWIELFIAWLLFSALILWFIRWYEGDRNLIRLHENPEAFISFQYAAAADEVLTIVMALIVFFSTIKILKLLQIFPTFVILKGIIVRSSKPMLNYFLPFILTFIVFAIIANLMFFKEYVFHNILKACETQLLMLLGGSVFTTLAREHPVYAAVYFFLFAMLETVILMNIFVSILDKSIGESDAESELQNEDLEFIDFAYKRCKDVFSSIFGCFHGSSKKSGPNNANENSKEELKQRKVSFASTSDNNSCLIDFSYYGYLKSSHIGGGSETGRHETRVLRFKPKEGNKRSLIALNLAIKGINNFFEEIDDEYSLIFEKKMTFIKKHTKTEISRLLET